MQHNFGAQLAQLLCLHDFRVHGQADDRVNLRFELVIREEQLSDEKACVPLGGYAYFARHSASVAE
jgi:hypothetical protein